MTSTTQDQADQKHHEEKLLHVTVFSPRTPEPRHYTWEPSLLVGEAARQAATDFGHTGGTPGFQNREQRVLDNQKSLRAEGVRNGDQLELIDTTGGV